MSNTNEMTIEMRNRIELGMDAQKFLESKVGIYLTTRAEAMIQDGLNALKDADAENPTLIRTLQNNVKVGDMIQQWLADAVNEGWAAENEFTNAPPDVTGG